MAKVNSPVDDLLTQTIKLFESDITTTDISVAIKNVTAWIDFLNQDESPVAPIIAGLLQPLLVHLNNLNPVQINQDISNLSGPTTDAGDPTAPVGSRPKQISRLGVLLCGG